MSKQQPSENLEILRHSTSHVLAAAVLQMFPEAKFAIGPAIENGFYYDFDLPRTLIPEDLEILEEKMRGISEPIDLLIARFAWRCMTTQRRSAVDIPFHAPPGTFDSQRDPLIAG